VSQEIGDWHFARHDPTGRSKFHLPHRGNWFRGSRQMKKFNVVAASAVALSAALAGGSAHAHGTLAVTTANYNAALVLTNNGVITVPWSGPAAATYSVNTGSLEVNSRFTVTLPAGFTFASQPSLATTAPTTTALTGGGIGSQTATFTIGTAPLTGTAALNTVSVQGATALEVVNTTGLPITVQSTNNALVTNNDPIPVPGDNPAFTSDGGFNPTAASFTGGGAFIDLGTTSLGEKFIGGLTTATIGTFNLVPSNSLDASGVPHPLATTDTVTLSINGFFNGITEASATGVAAPGIPPVGGTITLPGASITSDPIVLTAGGTKLLQQNPNGSFTVTFTPSATAVDLLAGSFTNPTGGLIYTGGQVVPVSNFLTGSDAGYTSLVRVNNAGAVPVTLFAEVEPYTGGALLVGSLGSLGAGIGTVFLESAVEAAVPGLTLANSGQRATLTIIAVGTGATNVAASDLLVNPGGVVVNVN
jgi:hypothetical protein